MRHALALAAEGYRCLPCRWRHKAPTCPHGYRDATADAEGLRELWRRHPGELVGVATGFRSGIDALDIDAGHPEARAWWREHRAAISPTRTHRTRSGGLHLLFRNASGMRCSAGRIALGIDARGTGGYIIWWPAAGFPVLADGPIATWPAWLVAELHRPLAPAVAPARAWSTPAPLRDRARRYAIGALRRAIQRVVAAPEGQRNNTLNAETFRLTRFLAGGALGLRELAEAMAHAGLAAGLPGPEVQRTIASALGAGDSA
ncbi:MAG: bifunctional DNA primase/polymerase [Acetobacteraceae bacterium]|nr:bifunctional DNA primase/polymerase [Acetobacteraceae bacterium]